MCQSKVKANIVFIPGTFLCLRKNARAFYRSTEKYTEGFLSPLYNCREKRTFIWPLLRNTCITIALWGWNLANLPWPYILILQESHFIKCNKWNATSKEYTCKNANCRIARNGNKQKTIKMPAQKKCTKAETVIPWSMLWEFFHVYSIPSHEDTCMKCK